MISTGKNPNLSFRDLIDEAMFAIYSARPTTGEVTFEGLWFSEPMKRVSLNVPDQSDYAQCFVAIPLNPPR